MSFINIITLIIGLSQAQAHIMTCDMANMTEAENSAIESSIRESVGNSKALVQCGLPGEILKICSACAQGTSEQSMSLLRPMLAEEGHAKWHAAWHNLRLSTSSTSKEIFAKAQENGFIPRDADYANFVSRHILGGTLAGEDFLAMHRLMIKMTQAMLSQNDQPCFAPWTTIPEILDSVWPVPKKLDDAITKVSVQKEWQYIQAQFLKLKNPVLLKNISLNRLGELIEPNMHQSLHHLYQSVPVCSEEAKAQGYCDDLIPVETSPLNKHFWKIHGLVDGLIGDWLKAHDFDEISFNCNNRQRCYQWGKVWFAPAKTEM